MAGPVCNTDANCDGLRLPYNKCINCADIADQKIPELLNQKKDYATLPADMFGNMGWDLPDGGRAVKALADAAREAGLKF